MSQVKKVVVLLSSFNGEKYIAEQIESILDQVECEVKLVVRDDGSSDKTVQILNEFSNKYDIDILIGNNLGYVGSFFELMKYALTRYSSYKYFSLSDQDDIWDNDKLIIACRAIDSEQSHIPILYGSTTRLVSNNMKYLCTSQKCLKQLTFFNTIIQNFIPGHSQVMNKPLLEMAVKYSDYEKVYVHDSYIVNCAILGGKVIFDENPHTNYRQHDTNQLGSNKGFFSWLKSRIKRIHHGHGKKYAIQIKYLCDSLKSYMKNEQIDEMNLFFKSNKNFFTRLKYVFHTKLYRQKKRETLIFKLYYAFGGYRVKYRDVEIMKR